MGIFGFLASLFQREPPASNKASGVSMQPVSDAEVVLVVSGWKPDELRSILADFSGMYGPQEGAFDLPDSSHHSLRIRLDQPISACNLLYLVNYLNYPKTFDLTGRSIAAAATVTLGPAFGVTAAPLMDQKAVFYVPTDDDRFDEVYATTADGSAFRVTFRDMAWREVDDARCSMAVKSLAQAVAR
ncbi:MAG: hypothetical protein ABIT10_08855 [Alteraurantiacibacter sp.]